MLSTMNRKGLNRPCASMRETHARPGVSQRSKSSGCSVHGAVGRNECAWKVGRRDCAPRDRSLSTKVSAETEWGLPMKLAGETEAAERLFSGRRCSRLPPRLGQIWRSPPLRGIRKVRGREEASRLRLPCNNQLQGTPPSYLPFVVTLRPVVRGTSRGGSWGAPEFYRYTACVDGALR